MLVDREGEAIDRLVGEEHQLARIELLDIEFKSKAKAARKHLKDLHKRLRQRYKGQTLGIIMTENNLAWNGKKLHYHGSGGLKNGGSFPKAWKVWSDELALELESEIPELLGKILEALTKRKGKD